ncbi:MAG: histidine kinase N-terminal 7TM domain-containing protein [Cyclobacteriaceae bacterium]
MFPEIQFYPVFFLLLLLAVVLLGFPMYLYIRKNDKKRPFNYFLWLMMACFIYSIFYFLELLLVDPELKIAMMKIQYLGAVLFGPFTLLFTLHYTRNEISHNKQIMLILFLVPAINLILVGTNELHHLFYASFSLQYNGYFDLLVTEKGIFYWVHQGYTLTLLFISLGLLFLMIREVPPSESRQVFMVISGLSSPLLVYLWYLLGEVPYQIDPIPLGFLGTGIFVFLGLKRFKLFKIAPLAYRTLFDNLKEGVLVTDVAGEFVTCNLAANNTLGFNILDESNPLQAIAQHWPEISDMIQSPKKHVVLEFVREYTGYNQWFLITKSQIMDQSQTEMGSIVLIRDVSQEKHYQFQIEQSREEAESANKAKSEFLANMSHEIRTPLNGVIGFTELLSNTQLNDQQDRYAKTALSSANALLDLINDILDLAKIEAGKTELNIQRVNLMEVLENIINVMSYHAHAKNLELILEVDDQLPEFVFLDELKLKQVLVNLLNNSLKFTRTGEVIFKIENLGRSQETSESGPLLRFIILDSGIGIEGKKKQLIFDAFSQADSSTTKTFGGTGLGLTISSKLLYLMGSQIKLESQAGKGSRFYFDLDLKSEGGLVSYPDFGPLTDILLIDNNKFSGENIKGFFKRSNIRTWLTKSIPQALKWLEEGHEFKVIMLNQRTMGISSIIAMERMIEMYKSQKRKARFVIIIYSNDKEELVRKYNEIGCDGILDKPVTLKKIQLLFDGLLKKEKTGSNKLLSENRKENHPGVKLLLVEDNAVNRMLIRVFFERLYPKTYLIEAENGNTAYQIFLSELPDLVITEISMPGMNGYELCAAIRKHPAGKLIPIIGFSANAFIADDEKARHSGFDDYLTKPVVQKKFASIMSKWIPKK